MRAPSKKITERLRQNAATVKPVKVVDVKPPLPEEVYLTYHDHADEDDGKRVMKQIYRNADVMDDKDKIPHGTEVFVYKLVAVGHVERKQIIRIDGAL